MLNITSHRDFHIRSWNYVLDFIFLLQLKLTFILRKLSCYCEDGNLNHKEDLPNRTHVDSNSQHWSYLWSSGTKWTVNAIIRLLISMRMLLIISWQFKILIHSFLFLNSTTQKQVLKQIGKKLVFKMMWGIEKKKSLGYVLILNLIGRVHINALQWTGYKYNKNNYWGFSAQFAAEVGYEDEWRGISLISRKSVQFSLASLR